MKDLNAELNGNDFNNVSGQESENQIDINHIETIADEEDPEIREDMTKYCEKSLNFFMISNIVRKNCIRCIESPMFEGFILFLIFFNSV